MKKSNQALTQVLIIGAVALLFILVGTRQAPEASSPSPGWAKEESGTYYRLENGENAIGWQNIDGLDYYFLEDGTMATGWTDADDHRFYFREDGTMVTGWLSLNGHKYYFNPDGTAASGLRQMEGEDLIFDRNGKLASGPVEVGGMWYLADGDGHPQSGWAETGNTFRYFDDRGAMITGWITIGNFPHYFLSDGTPAQGEEIIEGQTHYFSTKGQEIILVSPWNPLPEDYTVELTPLGGRHNIASYAYPDFEAMMNDCRAAGNSPAICSSYRTLEYQQGLFDRKVKYYLDRGYSQEESEERAGQVVAVPGTSEHQLGLALDLVDNGNWHLDESQESTPAQQWLMANSWRYGFILRYPKDKSDITGIIYEPWHYRYVGREVAAEMHEQDLCLEEYLGFAFG